MNFEHIANIFPKEEKYWPCMAPSKALPLFIRAFMREKFGGVFAANDIFKKNTPARMGVTTRPFEIGDPISTISRNHFIKTQELLTKVDYGPGRQKVVVIFHNYPNMTYHSEFTEINKGQLANGVLAILEEAHKSLSHYFKIYSVNHHDLFTGAKFYSKELHNAEYAYFITDLLFDYEHHLSAAQKTLELLNTFKIKKAIFILTRDPMEIKNKEENVEELIPWEKEITFKKYHHFSGEEYTKNIAEQIYFLEENIFNNKHILKIITAKDNVIDFINFILSEIFRKK